MTYSITKSVFTFNDIGFLAKEQHGIIEIGLTHFAFFCHSSENWNPV